MSTLAFSCRNCGHMMAMELHAARGQMHCGRCHMPTTVQAFPALWEKFDGAPRGEQVILDDDSTCFYHAEKRAVIVCESCGRFLCGLCDTPFNGRHVCPGCIERSTTEGSEFQPSYTYYDTMALSMSLLFLIPPLTYFSMFTAPIALFFAIRYWNTPTSAVPRRRWRFVVAITLSIVTIVLWLAGISTFFGFWIFAQ